MASVRPVLFVLRVAKRRALTARVRVVCAVTLSERICKIIDTCVCAFLLPRVPA